MLDTPIIKNIYKEIQKKLYYMIPEKWEKLYLYASITEKAYKMPIGELYFYYFPKGLIKKNPVNVYEIPRKFNIDERQYLKLVKNLYGSINRLREEYKNNEEKLWTSITISIENYKFKIEYNYSKSEDTEFTNYDRHLIWRYEHLGTDINAFSKKEKKVIEQYLINNTKDKKLIEIYEEPVYKKPIQNILDYNKSKFEISQELNVMQDFEAESRNVSNQILTGFNNINKK